MGLRFMLNRKMLGKEAGIDQLLLSVESQFSSVKRDHA